ncbi:helix-turn-helix domain-containing protein [Nonomuraea thailandensis]|uniref:helix-turn-helix domain-containing protein n=1 Tax=Nonomuraea thailandensis TaxID=1188745 RepID=UPI003558CEFB
MAAVSESSLAIGPVGHNVLENVRRLRLAQGLSAQQLADRIAERGGKLDRPAISKIELAKRRVNVDDLAELAEALGVAPADLIAAAPDCRQCHGAPPAGFQCRVCGAAL